MLTLTNAAKQHNILFEGVGWPASHFTYFRILYFWQTVHYLTACFRV